MAISFTGSDSHTVPAIPTAGVNDIYEFNILVDPTDIPDDPLTPIDSDFYIRVLGPDWIMVRDNDLLNTFRSPSFRLAEPVRAGNSIITTRISPNGGGARVGSLTLQLVELPTGGFEIFRGSIIGTINQNGFSITFNPDIYEATAIGTGNAFLNIITSIPTALLSAEIVGAGFSLLANPITELNNNKRVNFLVERNPSPNTRTATLTVRGIDSQGIEYSATSQSITLQQEAGIYQLVGSDIQSPLIFDAAGGSEILTIQTTGIFSFRIADSIAGLSTAQNTIISPGPHGSSIVGFVGEPNRENNTIIRYYGLYLEPPALVPAASNPFRIIEVRVTPSSITLDGISAGGTLPPLASEAGTQTFSAVSEHNFFIIVISTPDFVSSADINDDNNELSISYTSNPASTPRSGNLILGFEGGGATFSFALSQGTNTLSVNPTSILLNALTPSTQTISVTGISNWEVVSDSTNPWTATRSGSNVIIAATPTPIANDQDITNDIIIRGTQGLENLMRSVSITRLAPRVSAIIDVNGNTYNFGGVPFNIPNTETDISFTIDSTVPWSISIAGAGTIPLLTGSGNSQVEATIPANTGSSARTITLTLSITNPAGRTPITQSISQLPPAISRPPVDTRRLNAAFNKFYA